MAVKALFLPRSVPPRHWDFQGYLSIKYTERLAESTIGLFKTEVINCMGPWKTVGQVEWETLKWVNWFNTEHLHSAIGYIAPQEAEEVFYANINKLDKLV